MRPILTIATLTLCCAVGLTAQERCLVKDGTIMFSGGSTAGTLSPAAWGPKWAYMGWKGRAAVSDGVSRATLSRLENARVSPTTDVLGRLWSHPKELLRYKCTWSMMTLRC